MVKLIASDLDGTLLQNGARDVNPIVFDQIRTLKEHGIMFAAASGRQYLNLRRLFTPVQDDIAYIAENGSLCIYNEETISKGIIEQDLAYRILDEVARYPQYNCIISGERVCYSTSKNPEFYNHMVNVIKNHMKFIDDPKSEIPEPILKIAVCDYNGTDACEKHLLSTYVRRSKSKTGYISEKTIYQCSECKDCPYKRDCIKGNNCKTPMEERHKVLSVAKTFLKYRKEDLERILSDEGIHLRTNRSIQVEGSFGELKQDMQFRRYLSRGTSNVLAESILLAMAKNVNKLHNKIQKGKTGKHLFPLKTA